jgi:hypothetical protein
MSESTDTQIVQMLSQIAKELAHIVSQLRNLDNKLTQVVSRLH